MQNYLPNQKMVVLFAAVGAKVEKSMFEVWHPPSYFSLKSNLLGSISSKLHMLEIIWLFISTYFLVTKLEHTTQAQFGEHCLKNVRNTAIFWPIMVKMLRFKKYFVLKVPFACQLCRSCLCCCTQIKANLFGFHLRPKTAEYLQGYGNHVHLCDPYP